MNRKRTQARVFKSLFGINKKILKPQFEANLHTLLRHAKQFELKVLFNDESGIEIDTCPQGYYITISDHCTVGSNEEGENK